MSETFEKISQTLDEDVEFAAATSFIACQVDESCGQDGPHAVSEPDEFIEELKMMADMCDDNDDPEEQAMYIRWLSRIRRGDAHVTRLQAVNAALQARLTVADQRVDDLQSELTKAQELFREIWEFSDRLPDDLRDRTYAAAPNQTGEQS